MMSNNPMFFESVTDKRKGVVMAEQNGGGVPAFPVPMVPTSRVSLGMSFTKDLGDYQSRKGNVFLSVPLNEADLESTWDSIKAFVRPRLVAVMKGEADNPQAALGCAFVPSDVVPPPDVVVVSPSYSRTLSLGNFEFVSVDVGLTLLAAPDKAGAAFAFAYRWCQDKAEALLAVAEKSRR